MRISITITSKNPVHIRFNVFVNGALSGELTLRNEEWSQFMEVLQPDKIYNNTRKDDDNPDDFSGATPGDR